MGVPMMDRWLLPNCLTVLKRAWSIRLLLLAAVLSGAEIALPLIRELVAVPPKLFLVLSILATAGALVARLVAQKNITGGK